VILRVPTDLRKPPPGRPPDDYDVVSVTTQCLIGRIYKVTMADGRPWRWATTSVFIPNDPSSGHTYTLEDAKREFAAAWRAWLAKAGKDEETYRPRYGSPASPS
jgi:hypothetical protein